jgi:hypothetical protein
MSRANDIKEAVLELYPDKCHRGVDLFGIIIDETRDNIEYELGETIEEYLYGKQA